MLKTGEWVRLHFTEVWASSMQEVNKLSEKAVHLKQLEKQREDDTNFSVGRALVVLIQTNNSRMYCYLMSFFR